MDKSEWLVIVTMFHDGDSRCTLQTFRCNREHTARDIEATMRNWDEVARIIIRHDPPLIGQ